MNARILINCLFFLLALIPNTHSAESILEDGVSRIMNKMTKNNFLIVANSPSLDMPPRTVKENASKRTLIALDGAADKLYATCNIMPDIILGDLDSIDKTQWQLMATFGEITETSPPYMIKRDGKEILVVPAKDQNLTDLEKAILLCDKAQTTDILILNATGGRMDHTLGNIRTLKKHYSPSRKILMRTEQQTLEVISISSGEAAKTFYMQGQRVICKANEVIIVALWLSRMLASQPRG